VGAALVWRAAAPLTLLFLVSTPVILGHAAVVALDVPVTAMTMLSLYLLLRWFESPGLASALRLGLAAGLAIATKMSALPFIRRGVTGSDGAAAAVHPRRAAAVDVVAAPG